MYYFNDIMQKNDNEEFSWIEQYEKEEELYENFYLLPVNQIELIQILLDNNGKKCLSSTKYIIDLKNPNVLSTEELSEVIIFQKKQGFKLETILRFNPEIEPNDIRHFTNDISFIDNYEYDYNWLKEVSYMVPIKFNDTIGALHNLNTIIIFFKKVNTKISTSKSINNHKNKYNKKTKKANNFNTLKIKKKYTKKNYN